MTRDQQRRALQALLRTWRAEYLVALEQLRLLRRLRARPWWWLVLHPRAIIDGVRCGLESTVRVGTIVEQMVHLCVTADLDLWEPEAQADLEE